jgi:hypothetical protein
MPSLGVIADLTYVKQRGEENVVKEEESGTLFIKFLGVFDVRVSPRTEQTLVEGSVESGDENNCSKDVPRSSFSDSSRPFVREVSDCWRGEAVSKLACESCCTNS